MLDIIRMVLLFFMPYLFISGSGKIKKQKNAHQGTQNRDYLDDLSNQQEQSAQEENDSDSEDHQNQQEQPALAAKEPCIYYTWAKIKKGHREYTFTLFDKEIVLSVIRADITKEKVDAIVNAANPYLQHAGGVAQVISNAAGGYELMCECTALPTLKKEKWGQEIKCEVGGAVRTSAYKLQGNGVKIIVHAVAPESTSDGDKMQLLKKAYKSSLREIRDYNASSYGVQNPVQSVAFPALGIGIFGLPKKESTHVAINTIINDLIGKESTSDVRFIIYDNDMVEEKKVFQLYNNVIKEKLEKLNEKTIEKIQRVEILKQLKREAKQESKKYIQSHIE